MAKPKTYKDSVSDFSSVNNFLSEFDKEGQLAENYTELDPTEWIHSGNYMLNAQLSGSILKGHPNNKIVIAAGVPKSGKSELCLNAMIDLQRKGYFIWVWETENAYTKQRMISKGIDLSRTRITMAETGNQITGVMVKVTESFKQSKKEGKPYPKIALFIDSITGLLSKKQLADAVEGELAVDMGGQAREVKTLFNFLSKRCGSLGIPIIATAHTYEDRANANPMSRTKEYVVSSGLGSIYFGSVVLNFIKRNDTDKETKERVGIKVVSKCIENRFALPRDIQLYLPNDRPMNPYLGLENFLSLSKCGVGKGKLVDFYDLANECYLKKKITEANCLTTFFTVSELEKMVSKDKQEYFLANLQKNISLELCYIVGGSELNSIPNQTIGFTKKVEDNFVNSKYVSPHADTKFGFEKATSPGYVVEHLNKVLPLEKIFTKEVFTDEVLEKLDKIISPQFSYPSESEKTRSAFLDMTDEEIDAEISSIQSGDMSSLNDFLNME